MLTAATGAEDHSLAPLTHAVPDLMDVRQAIDAVLAEFLAAKRRSARPTTRELIDTLRAFLLASGKRIRPMMRLCVWYAANGRGSPEPVVRAAASLELFAQLRVLPALVGRTDLTQEQAEAVRAVLTGARLEAEGMIARRFRRAPAALDRAPVPESATASLRQLAYATSARRS
ncbi:hypothetical protein [Streptomyces sp. NPDC002402]